MRRACFLAIAWLFSLDLVAQSRGPQNSQEIRAAMKSGRPEQGKCTVEVEVDVTAEVEIFGDHAVIRTIAGLPSTFRRMECTGPMPLSPLEFEFTPVDRSGAQTLLHDPRSTGGRALVRIDNRKSGDLRNGRQGYTFDLTWRTSIDPREFGTPAGREQGFGPQIEFSGTGDGYFRRNGVTDRLGEIEVIIRASDVKIMFFSPAGAKVYFSGRLIHVQRNHLTAYLTAEMSSSSVSGKMTIDLDYDRVRYISMSGAGTGIGRDRFEMRWHN